MRAAEVAGQEVCSHRRAGGPGLGVPLPWAWVSAVLRAGGVFGEPRFSAGPSLLNN